MSDLARVPIGDIWQRLGGAPLRHGRAAAFWRRGDNPGAVSVNPARGVWHDFVVGEGGGILRLIEVALNTDRPGALRWLETEGFIEPRETTAAERRAHAERRGRARELARLALLWRSERLADLEEQKRAAVDADRFNPWTLQAAASEHFRLTSLDEASVLREWLAARTAEPVATRMLERRSERWERACKDIVRLVVDRLAEVANAA